MVRLRGNSSSKNKNKTVTNKIKSKKKVEFFFSIKKNLNCAKKSSYIFDSYLVFSYKNYLTLLLSNIVKTKTMKT